MTTVTLSVVVAAWTGPAALGRCLDALRAQLNASDEIIVARNFETDLIESSVKDLPHSAMTNVPQLRAAGFAAASGAFVAFLEDHVEPKTGWREAIVLACTLPKCAVGGPVDLAPGGRPIDWATYFYDYSSFAPPQPTGPTRSLSGANMAFSRAVLTELGSLITSGVHEGAMLAALRARGVDMWLAEGAHVQVARREGPVRAVRLAFWLARGYQGRRHVGSSLGRRIAQVLFVPLVPPVLFARVVRRVSRSSHLRGRFVRSMFWVLVLQSAWAIGEGVGAVAGVGRADHQWR